MKRTARYRLTTLACAIAAGLGASTTAMAQDDDNDNESLNAILEEVIVTASRREEALQDVAMAVSVIDVDKYADAGLTGLDEVLPFVPGVSVIASGRPYFSQVYVRGINAVLSAGVTSYMDEIPFGSSTVYTSNAPLDGTLLDLANMDVLKGPQGTLYGASAIGGILKFNTRAPSLEDWSGSASANLSDTNEGGFNQLYRFNLNGPIVGDTLGVSFTAFSQDDDGYIDNVNLDRENWDSSEYYGGSGSLLWQATEDLSFTLQAMYQNATQNGASTIQANGVDDFPIPGVAAGDPIYGEYATGEADLNPSEYEAQLLGLTIRYHTGFGEFLSVTSSQEMSFAQSTDLTAVYAPLADVFFPANAPHTLAIFSGDLGFDKVTQEFRLTSDANENFEWLVGAYYTKEDGFNIQEIITEPVEDFFFANFPSTYTETSAFATGTYYFTPKLDASIGLRYTDYSNDVELEAKGPLVAPLPYVEIEDDVTNYLANIRYRPTDNVSLYGRIASGYRPGGANFLLLDTAGNPLTQQFFAPDDLVSYEFGVKGTTSDNRFSYDLSAFRIDWEDYQIRVTRAGLSVAANAGKATSQGIETALGFAVTDNFTLSAALTWTDAEMGEDEPDLGSPKGEQLPDTPEWQASVNADYTFDIGSMPAYVGASWRYKDEMPTGFSGYTGSDGTYYAPTLPRIIVDSYDLVDLRSGITVGNFDFSLYVTNVFDEWAYTSFSPSFTGFSTGVPTRPRTVGGVVRWNFF